MKTITALIVLLTVSVEGKYHCGRDVDVLCPNGDCDLETGVCDNCASGYSGYTCEVVTADTTHEDCSPNPCEHGGTCWKGSGPGDSRMCLCTEDWTGSACTDRRYELSCTYAGDGSMSMTIRPQGTVNGYIFLKGKDPETDTACVFSGSPLSLLSLSHVDTTCGSATVDDTERIREVLVLFENRLSPHDELVTFTCGDSETVEISGSAVTVNALDSTFLAVSKSLAPLTDDLDLQLLAGDTAAATVNMGTKIKVKADLTAAGAGKFEAIMFEECVVASHANPSAAGYIERLFIDDYCPSEETDDVMPPAITVDGTSVYFEFFAFKFMLFSELHITCSVQPCEEEADCVVDCSGGGRRKKRQAGTETTPLQRSINISDPLAIASINQQLSNNKACYQTWEMTATVVALAVALVIVLFIAIILIVKVIASRKSDQGMSCRDLSETSSTAHFPNLPTIISNKC